MERLRVAVIGCGSVAWLAHFPSIDSSERLELAVAYSPNPESARRAAARWGGTAVSDFGSLLADGGFDVAVVCSPNVFHFEQTIALLEAGHHVYVEKPMCSTNTQAWQMVERAKEKGLRLTVGCHQRFYLQHQWAKDLIQQGVIGDVRFARTSLHETWQLYQHNVATSDFRLDARQAVAGTLYDQGSHRVDLLLWLMGSRPTEVVGVATNVASPELGEVVDDLALANFRCENGAFGIVTTDKFAPVVSNITEIYGTHGVIFASSEVMNPFQSVPLAVYSDRDYEWDTLPELIRQYRWPNDFWVTDLLGGKLPKRWISLTPPRVAPFSLIWEDFATSVLEGRPPLVTPEDGAFTMEVLCGVFEAMDTRSWVSLPIDHEVIPPALRNAVSQP